ncbi:c-type cytochrome [Marinivivus vitaminiproducens]|uniref:c-type cytochrome n=1 Tax=Marinivivus vitaminiproducens TaxID=3035935 RepID=UPI0027A39C89|nr:c-type cytochrome [Geminicoccaceae bacterium SCSIO 64248]
MLLTWKRAVIAIAAMGVAGMLFAWSGLFNVAASVPHFAVTNWFLHWVMQNSVWTYSVGTEVPDLSDPAMLYPGAGHYESGCASCHGAPGQAQSPVVAGMSPPPPYFPEAMDDWSEAELAWIVQHGVKFSGMPPWPAHAERADEVWPVVAFLRELPGMSPERYRDLAFGPAADQALRADLDPGFQATLADCARCHEADGSGRGAFVPIIAGQKEGYLKATLRAYADGTRHSGMMQPAANDAGAEMRDRLAAHYASQPPVRTDAPVAADEASLERGRTLAERGRPQDGIPPCLSCHAPTAGRDPAFPILDGQHARYLEQQLHLFHDGARGGTPYAHLMTGVTRRMTPEDMAGVAAYFASRPVPENVAETTID